MTFRQRVYLRLVLTFAAAALLTGFALNLAASAQGRDAVRPLFALTDQSVYAVYPFEERQVALDIPGKTWNMVLSPDGTTLLVDSQPDGALPALDHYTVDVETLDIRQLPLRDGGVEVTGMPVWRWDSGALLYTEFDADRVARVVEYTLDSGQRTVRADDLLSGGDLGTSGVPLAIFWSPDAFALLHYDDDHKAYLLRYNSSGTALTPVMLYDPLDADNPDNLYFDNFVHVAGEDGGMLAVRRPEIGQWDVIDVLSGEITRLAEGIEVVKATAGVRNPRFVMTIDDAILFPAIHNLAALINGQRGLFLPVPKSVLTISPEGEYYAVADADGFAMTDGDYRIPMALPPDDWMLTWRVAWAPLEGRIEPIGRFRLDGAEGRFRQGSDGLLVLLDTPTGELPVATTHDVRLAPNGESIVWISRGVNNQAQVMRYDWATNETAFLFSGEYTEAMPPLPVIADYDGALVTLDGEEGRFTLDLDGNLTRIEGEETQDVPEAARDMPLYFIDTLDCVNRWTMRDGITGEQCPNEHGGTRYFAMSPDASKLLWVTRALLDDAPYELNWSFIDTQAFDRIAGLSTGERDHAPIWRWDSGATAEIAFKDEGATIPMLLEYDIVTGDQTIVLDHLPVGEDAGMPNAPDPIWWTEMSFGLRYETGANGQTYILVYGTDGEEQQRVLVSDLSAEPDSRVTYILPTINEAGWIAALYYPDRDQWMQFSPETGELTPLSEGFTVAEAPAAHALDAHYCRTGLNLREPQQVIVCETGEPVLDAPAARVEISPDGSYYAYATPDGIFVGGVDMPEAMIYANERQTPMDDPWFMAWSGMVGRIVPQTR